MDDYEDYLQAQLASEMKDLLKITLNVIIILVGKCKTIEGAKRELEKIRVSILFVWNYKVKRRVLIMSFR